jgi:antirestriction protein ArdC
VSEKPYRGVNAFLLATTKYVSPYWLTLKQANQPGGAVRKGEHGEIVIFWKLDYAEKTEAEPDAEKFEAGGKTSRRFVLRFLPGLERGTVRLAASRAQ